MQDDHRAPGLLDRALRPFTEVRAGEAATALVLTAEVFLLLTAYYVIKPVREALILAGGGAEVKAYAAVGQAALLALVVVPTYSRLAAAVGRRALTNGVTLFFVANLLLFYFGAKAAMPLGVPFFLWVGIFSVVIVAQFWSFANDVYSREQGERLFVLLAFGASSGAVCGSWITGALLDWVEVPELMLVAAGILIFSLGLANWVESREAPRAAAKGTVRPLERGGAFRLVLSERYLLLIALTALLLNWVNSNGEYLLGSIVSAAATEAVANGSAESAKQFIGRFYSDFFTWVNVLGLLLQLFVVSRIVRFTGVRVAIAVLPVIAFGAYALMVFHPALGIVRWAKTLENATDYSLNNTVRNALFLPASRAEKYKAKQVVDTFVVRAGDVLSALLVFAGTQWLVLGTSGFAMVNGGLALLAIVAALATGSGYVARSKMEPGLDSGGESTHDPNRPDGPR